MDYYYNEESVYDGLADLLQLQLRETHTSTEMYVVKTDNDNERNRSRHIEADFQVPSYDRLMRSAGIMHYTENCIPVVRELIANEIECLVNVAMIILDGNESATIKPADVLVAMDILSRYK